MNSKQEGNKMRDYIPEEVVVGVLKRLPVKSVVRCRSVCKQWKQLISSPCLVVEHLALQRPQSISIENSQRGTVLRAVGPHTLTAGADAFLYSGGAEAAHVLALVGTLHGIVCLLQAHFLEGGFYLWSPSVRRSLHVPVAPSMSILRDHDPDVHSWLKHAFWIDPCTGLFKIVVGRTVITYPDALRSWGAIYSSSSSSIGGGWKEMTPLQLKFVDKIFTWDSSDDPSLVMRDKAYWISDKDSAATFENEERGSPIEVASFDFEHERFCTIEGPPVTFCDVGHRYLSEWQGNLSFSYLARVDAQRNWQGKCQFYSRQQGSWVHLFSVSIALHIVRVFCLLKETDQGNTKILLAQNDFEDLVLYDNVRGDLLAIPTNGFEGQVAHNFVQSLVFPA